LSGAVEAEGRRRARWTRVSRVSGTFRGAFELSETRATGQSLAHRLQFDFTAMRDLATVSSAPSTLPAAADRTRRLVARPELSVVIPVYNEAAVIAEVIQAWLGELAQLGIDFELLAYDDGSRDDTGKILAGLAEHQPHVVVTRQANAGHGPTILRGYREARGEWVFQVDGDDEMSAEHFGLLWRQREDHDLILGRRQHRDAPLARRIITAASQFTVWVLFGRAVTDVNAPYRLIRRAALVSILSRIPAVSFAPNVIMSGLACRDRLRVRELWVPHRGRRTGTASIVKWRLWKAAARAFGQTVMVALRARRSP
jgi:glycosyltransferase involved in cell wall biosynthesis